MSFCSVADIAAFLQLPIAYDDASALASIAEAADAIQRHCRQKIVRVAGDQVTFDVPANTTRLFLPELPVTAVTAVVENGETLTVTDDYMLGNHGILYRISRLHWYPGVQTVTVTYTHGYADGDANLETAKSVCVRAAARRYQAGLRAAAVSGVPGVQGLGLGDYNVTYGGEGAQGTPNMLGSSAAPILLPSERVLLNQAYRSQRA